MSLNDTNSRSLTFKVVRVAGAGFVMAIGLYVLFFGSLVEMEFVYGGF